MAQFTTQFCPYTKTCLFYQNWVEQTKDRRTDIIVSEENGRTHYNCLALIALDDPETGIPMHEELKKSLSNPEAQTFNCSHLTLLNLLSGLTKN